MNTETPPILSPFRPGGLLANPHVQSLMTSGPWRKSRVQRRAAEYLARGRETVVDAGEGVRLLGFHHRASDPRRNALVIMLHGWEGSVDSSYLVSSASHLDAAGFDTFRLNFRDHGQSHHLNEDLFHSCRLREVRDGVAAVARDYTEGPVFLTGFSLGGNFALRIARTAAESALDLARTVAVCPVIRPARVLDALEDGPFFYQQYFVRKWRRSLKIKQALYPERYRLDDWFRLRGLRDQTDYLVEHFTEFPNLNAYLEGYSVAGDFLAGLESPTTIIAAADDPIIPVSDFHALPASPALEVELTPAGGHCGYLENWQLASWIDRRIENELCRTLIRN